MVQNLGYTKPLFILAFDHRASLEKEGFKDIPALKQIIYEGFKKSLNVVQNAALLVDEQYGDLILKDAKSKGYTILIPIEKAGREDFVFEYGDDFVSHIQKYSPDFAKVVIDIKNGMNDETKANLKKLNEYCHSTGLKFMLELISGGNVSLILKTIVELQDFGVEPDVWKVEGMENDLDYLSIIQEAKRNGRENVNLVILGRGESKELVEKWIKAGSKIKGIIGFAIGRTIFLEALTQFNNGKISREEAVEQISANYIHFYEIFNS